MIVGDRSRPLLLSMKGRRVANIKRRCKVEDDLAHDIQTRSMKSSGRCW